MQRARHPPGQGLLWLRASKVLDEKQGMGRAGAVRECALA